MLSKLQYPEKKENAGRNGVVCLPHYNGESCKLIYNWHIGSLQIVKYIQFNYISLTCCGIYIHEISRLESPI